jgi:hypothetical protein
VYFVQSDAGLFNGPYRDKEKLSVSLLKPVRHFAEKRCRPGEIGFPYSDRWQTDL